MPWHAQQVHATPIHRPFRPFRDTLLLVGVIYLVVGCGRADPPPLSVTATATRIAIPTTRIAPENASRVTQLAVLPSGDEVKSIAWSPDGKRLVAGADTVEVWNVETGVRLKRLPGHVGTIWAVAWSPDGRLLASAGVDGTVRVWDAQTGASVQVFQAHAYVLGVNWAPDSRRLVSSNRGGGSLDLWDVASGAHLASWQGSPPIQLKANATWALAAFSATFSPDGKRIASTREDGTIQLWDAQTGRVTAVLRTQTGDSNIVAWSPDGQAVAVSTDTGAVELWNTQTGQRQATLTGAPGGWANAVSWSPDGRMLAATRELGSIDLFVPGLGKAVSALQGHDNEVWAGAWAPDGLRIATGSKDRTIRLWGAPAHA